MSRVVYDAGALIAAERNRRSLWADHRARLDAGVLPQVPAPVVAQVSRSPRQVQLRRLLRGCDVVTLGEADAHAVGDLLGRSGSTDVVDATVVTVALRAGATIVTSDRPDIAKLLDAAGVSVPLADT